jgi:hypothetical protein
MDEEIMTEPTEPRRSRFTLSLRALMVLVLIVGGVLGWKARRVAIQRQAVAAIKAAGGSVKYDYEWGKSPNGDLIFLLNPKPWAPAWLRRSIGDEYFQEVSTVLLTANLKGRKPAVPPDSRLYETMTQLDSTAMISTLRCPLNDADFARLMAMPRLKDVFLMDMDITEAGLKSLETSPAIEKLTLRFKRDTVTGRALATIARQPRLRKVELIFINVTDPAEMAPLAKLSRLEYLRLNKSPLDESCLGPLRDLTSLQEIWLNETRLSDQGVESFVKMDQLETLGMDGSLLTDAGLARLVESHPRLKTLVLNSASNITDVGLASLEKLGSLTFLQLNKSRLTDAGIDHLQRMKLSSLDISGEGVTDIGLARLQKIPSLKYLAIHGTKVTWSGLEAFKKAMPGVTVTGGPTEPDPEP